MSGWTSDPKAGDICVQLAQIIDASDPDTIILAVNDEHGVIKKKCKMQTRLFYEQFHKLKSQPGMWVKRVRIEEIEANSIKFVILDKNGKEAKSDSRPAVIPRIFHQTYILEALAPITLKGAEDFLDQEPDSNEEEEILDLENEVE